MRFVPDPLSPGTRRRLFKTGDLARKLPDGEIAFVRRIDDQTKVRGFRVEPSEIAAALNRHAGILQSVVVARKLPTGEGQLIAYLVPKADTPPALSELRDFMRAQVPEYMVPERFVRLRTMPLSTNGKLSRNDLPEPDDSNTLQELTFTAPRTETEKTIAGILSSLLGVEKVDVEGNFFALGAHSLVGAQLIARIRRIVGVEMSLRTLFGSPTIAALSREIERIKAAKLAAAGGSVGQGSQQPAVTV